MRREALITASTCHFTIYFAYCYFKNLRDRWFDFCGKGMGDFRKKIYPVDWFRGEKNLARKYLVEKLPALKIMYTYRYIRCISGKESNCRGLGRISLPKPNHSYPPEKSNGRLFLFPCTRGPTCFSATTTVFVQTKKLVVHSKRERNKTYQNYTVKLINIWYFTETKQFSLEIYWKCEVLLEFWKSVQLCSKRKIELFSLRNN